MGIDWKLQSKFSIWTGSLPPSSLNVPIYTLSWIQVFHQPEAQPAFSLPRYWLSEPYFPGGADPEISVCLCKFLESQSIRLGSFSVYKIATVRLLNFKLFSLPRPAQSLAKWNWIIKHWNRTDSTLTNLWEIKRNSVSET